MKEAGECSRPRARYYLIIYRRPQALKLPLKYGLIGLSRALSRVPHRDRPGYIASLLFIALLYIISEE